MSSIVSEVEVLESYYRETRIENR